MTQQLLIAFMAIGGGTALWRSWLNDHESWKDFFRSWPHRSGRMFTCGTCFTYWVALVYVAFFDPLAGFTLHPRWSMSPSDLSMVIFLVSWMAVAWGSLIARFSYAALEELVSYMVHNLKEEKHQPH